MVLLCRLGRTAYLLGPTKNPPCADNSRPANYRQLSAQAPIQTQLFSLEQFVQIATG